MRTFSTSTQKCCRVTLSGISATPTKETHVILTIRFNLTSAFLQLSRKHEKTTKPHAMCDSSKFSDHAHGAHDSQHNDKLMSRNTISGRGTLPLFDSEGIKYTIKHYFRLQFILLSNVLNMQCYSSSCCPSGLKLSDCWIKY